jgi:hypothetical protein
MDTEVALNKRISFLKRKKTEAESKVESLASEIESLEKKIKKLKKQTKKIEKKGMAKPIKEGENMKLDDAIDNILHEMARGDLEGAGDALKEKDWAKAAKTYVENAKKRGLEDSKIVSGLGSTFRSRKNEEGVTVGKDSEDNPITLSSEDVSALKKAVKEYLGFVPKKEKKGKKVADQSKKDGEALKEKMPKQRDFMKETVRDSILRQSGLKKIF